MRSNTYCPQVLCCAVICLSSIFVSPEVSGQSSEAQRLRDVIDSHFADDIPKPTLAADAEFARRLAIDLTAMPLEATQLNEFLASNNPRKRIELIEQLVKTPQFERQLATFLDVTIMERRAYKDIKEPEWTRYLLDSVRSNKPWNVLAREILAADGLDDATRPAVRFALAREAEPNLLTRDIGRVFFGQDLQCAQCHNHPLVDDYLQSDYQGLLAFVAPGYIKTISRPAPPTKDGKKAKPISLKIYAEKDGNDISFESVFVKNTKHRTGPRIIGEKSILEPSVLPKVDPAKHRPNYSRRRILAEQATDGTNRAFNENMANRLWGLMMGRGLVDPPDFHHRDNPPSKPALMKELGSRFAQMNFDMKQFIVEIAASKVYQRAYDLPRIVDAKSAAEAHLKELNATVSAVEKKIESLHAAYDVVSEAWSTAETQHIPVAIEVEKLKKSAAATSVEAAKLEKLFLTAKTNYEKQREVRDLVIASAKSMEQAATIGDPDLVELNQRLMAKLEKIQASTKTLVAKVTTAENGLKVGQSKVKETVENLQKGFDKRKPLRLAFDRAEAEFRQVRTELADQMSRRSAMEMQVWTLEKIIELAGIESRLASVDKAADGEARNSLLAERDLLEDSISKRLSANHVVSALRPLTPEQYCWSILKVTGYYQRFAGIELQKLRKEQSLEAESRLSLEQQRVVEERTFAKLKGHLNNFIRYYSAGAGQPQGDFFATADQALFVVNGGTVNAYLNPVAGNVTDRMLKAKSSAEAAQELYLGILSRKPSASEAQLVQQYLDSSAEKKREAVMELAWGLINSAEFRFNH